MFDFRRVTCNKSFPNHLRNHSLLLANPFLSSPTTAASWSWSDRWHLETALPGTRSHQDRKSIPQRDSNRSDDCVGKIRLEWVSDRENHDAQEYRHAKRDSVCPVLMGNKLYRECQNLKHSFDGTKQQTQHSKNRQRSQQETDEYSSSPP